MGKVTKQFWKDDHAVSQLFKALGGKARFVGGCVRNTLLGEPITDIDIATPLRPDEVMAKLSSQGIKVIPTGLKFGTVTAVIDSKPYEITTLRKDVACDGRHADVEFTDDYEQDASRRDFTMNAMSSSLDGTLYDYFGGEGDLKQGIVKFVGDASQRCEEDLLRILRFFRFYAWYGKGALDKDALEACAALAPGIQKLSGERIQKEMLKLLGAKDPVLALQAMEKTSVLQQVLGSRIKHWQGLERQIGIEQRYGLPILPFLRLAHLMKAFSASKTEIQKLVGQWKLSNQDAALLGILALHPCSVAENIGQHYPYIRQYGQQAYGQLLRLAWAGEAENKDPVYIGLLKATESWVIPTFPLKGADLKTLGIAPGKTMGALLKRAEERWEVQGYRLDKEALLKAVAEWVKKDFA
jgi:poly(A) polymerase